MNVYIHLTDRVAQFSERCSQGIECEIRELEQIKAAMQNPPGAIVRAGL